MGRWVALLRGVNVGGGNKVPMARLRALAEGLGWGRVETVGVSGNMVFDAEGVGLAEGLRTAIAAEMAVDVPVMMLAGEDLAARVGRCPFDPVRGKDVHGFLLFSDARLDEGELGRWRAESEALVMDGRTAWLHAPEGIGRSKLAEKLHKVVVGAELTARNLNTLRTLVEMAGR